MSILVLRLQRYSKHLAWTITIAVVQTSDTECLMVALERLKSIRKVFFNLDLLRALI